MPYAHKYANAVTEHGMIDALRAFLPEDGKLGAPCSRAAWRWRRRTSNHHAQLLIDAEMKMFHGPEDAGDLHPERHHRPAARPGFQRPVQVLRTTTCAEKYGAEPGSSR
jgi:hypothetical protein